MWFIGVEVEQETSAPPPKKNPGSAPEVGTFFGEDTEVLQIKMIVFSFLNLGDGHNIVKPTNHMPSYSTCMSWLGMGDTYIDLCMTCSTISQVAQQRQF